MKPGSILKRKIWLKTLNKLKVMFCLLDDSDREKDERKFERRKSKSMAKARGQCLPMNFTMEDAASGILKERARIGSSLADVDPMNIDNKVTSCLRLSLSFQVA